MPPDPRPNPVFRFTGFALGLGVVLLTLALFHTATGFDFVEIDDGSFVTENPGVLDGLSWSSVSGAFTGFRASNWVPLSLVSLMVDSSLQGTGPAGYHRTNILLHALNALLLFLLARRLGAPAWAAALLALLFALHPLRAESVAWISERRDVLSTAFWLGATLVWVDWTRRRGVWRYALVVVLYALGLLSKGMLVTLPLALLILDWWPLRRKLSWSRSLLEKAPLFLLAALASAVTLAAQGTGTAMTTLDALGPTDRIANAIVGYAAYPVRMLWPAQLSYFYPHPSFVPPYEGWSPLRITLSGALLGLITIATALAARRNHRAPLAGWLWYLVTLLPVIGLVQVGMQATADRYTYVPQIGLLAVFVTLAVRLARAHLVPVLVVAGLLLTASAWATHRELPHWKDSEALFGRAIALQPDNGFALAALGTHYARMNRNAEAVALLERAVQATPGYAEARANLGITLVAAHEDERAENELRVALVALPDHARARVALGNLLARAGRLGEAAAEYRRALQCPSPPWEAEFGLGLIARTRGDDEAAGRRFARALALAPDAQARALIAARRH